MSRRYLVTPGLPSKTVACGNARTSIEPPIGSRTWYGIRDQAGGNPGVTIRPALSLVTPGVSPVVPRAHALTAGHPTSGKTTPAYLLDHFNVHRRSGAKASETMPPPTDYPPFVVPIRGPLFIHRYSPHRARTEAMT